MKILKKFVLLTLLFSLLIWACRKSNFLGTNDSEVAFSVKSAFDSIEYKNSLRSNVNDTIDLSWHANWTKVRTTKKGDTSFFFVPLIAKAVNTLRKIEIATDAQNIVKYLLLKRFDGKSEFYLETFIGYEQSLADPNKFSSDLSNFSGNLTLYNLRNKQEYIYEYTKGELKTNAQSTKLKSSNKTSSYLCTYIENCSWTRVCSEGLTVTFTESPSSEIPYAFPCPPPVNVPGCAQEGWTKSYSYLKVNCTTGSPPPAPPIPPGPIGGGPGGGTGNEGESSQTPVPRDTNIAKFVLYCSNFPKGAREKLNTTFYTLLNDPQRGCFYNYIYTSFKNPNNSVHINVCFGGNPNANGSYNSDTKTLYYPNDFMVTVTNTMGHEFFHVFQDYFYPGGISQYNTAPLRTGFSNIEFEQALFYDLISKGDIPTAMARGSTTQKDSYKLWLKTITSNWTTYPKNYSELGGRYFEFMEMFKSLYPEYNYPSKPDLLPMAMLSAFNGTPCKMP